MKEFSLDYLCCIKCGSKLELDIIKEQNEIEEGFLDCKNCNSVYPIIKKIPILWDDFGNYLAHRRSLGGKLANCVSEKMKKFVKSSFSTNSQKFDDRTTLEERWTRIYQNSKRSKFYSEIKNRLDSLPPSKLALEYGCSIGRISSKISDSCEVVFGVDRSFSAIQIAKKEPKENLDFLVADSLSPIFGDIKFDLILALNLLEIVEPLEFLNQISSQIQKGVLVISDPYDFERGKNSVKKYLDEQSLRLILKNFGFKIIKNTQKPSHIPWSLKLNQRSTLNYKTDLVICQK
ncbi:MAG: methyltransferase domain-containing protein [Nitrosopumilaceae archaeon]|nr:methyltransferase domain-containing protein [Nitrosopumilaceae archaeon]